VTLYISRELYFALIKLQADKGLGRSFAGLLALTEGLYRLGYLPREAYEEFVIKYMQPLARKSQNK